MVNKTIKYPYYISCQDSCLKNLHVEGDFSNRCTLVIPPYSYVVLGFEISAATGHWARKILVQQANTIALGGHGICFPSFPTVRVNVSNCTTYVRCTYSNRQLSICTVNCQAKWQTNARSSEANTKIFHVFGVYCGCEHKHARLGY